jgi:hypothetical protein
MKITPVLLTGLVAAAGLPLTATAASVKEVSKDIIAVQIRKQGFACGTPEKAERDQTTGNPDDPVWMLTCDNAVYRVHLIPNMAAKIERVSDDRKDSGQQP